jgi:hypothetical protein
VLFWFEEMHVDGFRFDLASVLTRNDDGERIFARHGLELKRSTTCDWMAACADVLRPLVASMGFRIKRAQLNVRGDQGRSNLEIAQGSHFLFSLLGIHCVRVVFFPWVTAEFSQTGG